MFFNAGCSAKRSSFTYAGATCTGRARHPPTSSGSSGAEGAEPAVLGGRSEAASVYAYPMDTSSGRRAISRNPHRAHRRGTLRLERGREASHSCGRGGSACRRGRGCTCVEPDHERGTGRGPISATGERRGSCTRGARAGADASRLGGDARSLRAWSSSACAASRGSDARPRSTRRSPDRRGLRA